MLFFFPDLSASFFSSTWHVPALHSFLQVFEVFVFLTPQQATLGIFWGQIWSGEARHQLGLSENRVAPELMQFIPSGELTKSYGKWPFIVDFPIKKGDFHLYGCVWKCCVPLNPMVFMIIIPTKWLFHWEYTLFSDKPILLYDFVYHLFPYSRAIGWVYIYITRFSDKATSDLIATWFADILWHLQQYVAVVLPFFGTCRKLGRNPLGNSSIQSIWKVQMAKWVLWGAAHMLLEIWNMGIWWN